MMMIFCSTVTVLNFDMCMISTQIDNLHKGRTGQEERCLLLHPQRGS